MKFFLIGLGGFIGSISRYSCSKFINKLFSLALVPYGTLFVNILGAFILSFLMSYNAKKFNIPENFILFFGTGLLGSFTTFSTFTLETITLFEKGALRGFLYLFIMIISGIFFSYLGFILGRNL